MLMARLCTKFNTAISNVWLVITIKPKAKPSLHSCQIILHLQKYFLREVAHICAIIHHTSHKNPNVRRGSDAPAFRVRISATLLLLMQGIKGILRCGGILWRDVQTKFCCDQSPDSKPETDTKRHKRRQCYLTCWLFYLLWSKIRLKR